MITPWKITQSLSKISNLFQNENLSYQADGYICSCGKTTIFINDILVENQTPYECEDCGNKDFYDVALFQNNNLGYDYYYKNELIEMPKVFFGDDCYAHLYSEKDNKRNIHDFPFEFKTQVFVDENIGSICYGFDIPYEIDLSKNELKIKFFKLLDFEIDLKTLQYSEKHTIEIFKLHKQEFEIKLIEQLRVNSQFSIPFGNQIKSVEQLIFFLQNKHLLDFNFWYWDKELIDHLPKENVDVTKAIKILAGENCTKSVLKAVYQNYDYQMNEKRRYHALLFMPFLKTITDPNILVKLLDLQLPEFQCEVDIFEEFLEFLKEYYTQIQIYNFFNKIDRKNYELIALLNDSLRMFRDLRIDKSQFTKVKCNVVDLHDEFIHATRTIYDDYISYQKLSYYRSQRKKCGLIKGYKVKLPNNGSQLILWSRTLQNCLSGYFQRILERKTIVYCFFENKRLIFAVELQNDKIVQAKQKYNQSLTPKQQEILDDWYKINFIQT